MAIDENNYKTMKLLRCKTCGNVYAASLTGSTECPDCESNNVTQFRPDDTEEPEKKQPGTSASPHAAE